MNPVWMYTIPKVPCYTSIFMFPPCTSFHILTVSLPDVMVYPKTVLDFPGSFYKINLFFPLSFQK